MSTRFSSLRSSGPGGIDRAAISVGMLAAVSLEMVIEIATGMVLDPPRRTQLQPEKRLMLAVLEGAVSDFQKYATALDGRGRRLFAEADAWFRSTAAVEPLDFENVCQALDLDPSFIREGLERWCIARRREPVHSVFPESASFHGGHA